jgi:regulator of sigma E protease
MISEDNGWLFRIYFYKWIDGRLNWRPIVEKTVNRPGKIGSKTEYVLALIPIGGYVKMAGIIDESMDTNISYEPDELMSKPLWAKLWVMSAGVIMNIVLAFFLFSIIGYAQGMPELLNEPIVAELQEDKPAQRAGIQPGDRIILINGSSIKTWDDLTSTIHALPNTEISLTVLREKVEVDVNLTTTTMIIPSKTGIDTLGAIGIIPEFFYKKITIGESLSIGLVKTVSSFGLIFLSLQMLGSGAASMADFGGPIMIAQLAGQTAQAGWIPFFSFMALISVNLAFLNILPIPGLDGGHILIHLIEAVIRRPMTIKARIIIQQIGMAFLLLIMITVVYNDIIRLLN